MPKKPSIVLCGAGGHGKVIADMVEKQGLFTIAGFIDDHAKGKVFGIPVLGGKDIISSLKKRGISAAVVSMGNADTREEWCNELSKAGLDLPVIIHPSAQIARGAELGDGTVVMPCAVVGPDVKAAEGCIINTSASVDHDCVLGKFTHIAPGAHLAGTVTVGDRSFVGVGTVVREGKNIGSRATIGAGSVVVADIPDDCLAYGVPAVQQDKK